MNANSTFQIGHDHTTCEDYALGWANPQADHAMAIVCDGCSASPEVDFGARILAKSAEQFLMFNRDNPLVCPKEIGLGILLNARKIFSMYPILHHQALDCTLLAASVSQKQLQVLMYGDGVLVHRGKAGVSTVHIQLSSGAPDYMSYFLDSGRKASYDAQVDNKKEIIVKAASEDLKFPTECKPLDPYHVTMPVEEGDVIAVISDGINSFKKSDNESIDWTALVDEFTAFRNFQGEFVQRRISAFKRKCVKEKWTHLDDISIAAIVV